MEWTDDGIVIGVRRQGEANAVVELLTREHGRHLGLVYGGAGRRRRPLLQPGNSLRAVWRARLDEQLGFYNVEGLHLRAGALLALPHAVYAVNHLSGLVRLLPERDPHRSVHDSLAAILDHLDHPAVAGALVARFELELLAEFGFGLDLEACAATGLRDNLAFVSPRSGRAVSQEAGQPLRERLLRLPAPLRGETAAPWSGSDLADAFTLTGHFLERHLFNPRDAALPDVRAQFIAAVMRAGANAA